MIVTSVLSCTSKGKSDGLDSTLNEVQAMYVPGDSIQDTDGIVYPTIKIGSQTWMAQDLRKTNIECDNNHQAKFINGLERGPGVKLYVNSPRYAWYKNNKELGFGVIYNFAVLQHCNLCPPGFRIPTKADWDTLIEKVGGRSVAAKELSYKGSSGFLAQLGGRIDSYGSVLAGQLGFWWCSDMIDEHTVNTFEIGNQGFVQVVPQPVRTGLYVRCVK